MNSKRKIKLDEHVSRLIALLVVMFVIMAITKSRQMLRLNIFQTIFRQMSEVGLMAIGCGICMISGGIDLSCVYIANLSGITAALVMQNMSGNVALGVIFGIIVGAACGAFNGFLVSYLKIPAMLATLGSYQVFQGIGIVLSDGSTVNGNDGLSKMGTTNVVGIPVPFLIFLAVVIVVTFIMTTTSFGRKIFFVGTNERCSIFAGIATKRILVKTYLMSGVLCGIAGILSLARINSAKADFGTSYTMQCILMSVLGGLNPDGGFGSIPGIAVAVFILQLLSAYLNTFPNISNYYRDMIWGVALIGVLITNYYFDHHKAAKLSKQS